MSRTCIDCAKPIGPYSVTGRCQRCAASAVGRDPDVRRRAAKSHSERRLGWCPPDLRPKYRTLLYRTGVGAAEARRRVTLEAGKRRLDDAIFYLRRLAPVVKREDGWQYGTVVLTAEQIVERAMFRGWQP